MIDKQLEYVGFLKAKVTLGVVGADVLHQLAQEFHISGILAVFHPGADEVAQNAAEVLMAGIAEEKLRNMSVPIRR